MAHSLVPRLPSFSAPIKAGKPGNEATWLIRGHKPWYTVSTRSARVPVQDHISIQYVTSKSLGGIARALHGNSENWRWSPILNCIRYWLETSSTCKTSERYFKFITYSIRGQSSMLKYKVVLHVAMTITLQHMQIHTLPNGADSDQGRLTGYDLSQVLMCAQSCGVRKFENVNILQCTLQTNV